MPIYDVIFRIQPGGRVDYWVDLDEEDDFDKVPNGLTSMSRNNGVCEYTVNVHANNPEDALQFASENYTVMFPEAGERMVSEEEVNQPEVGGSHSTVA